jgi:2-keto-4-pentenoate hydratase/2-oxohepta-3-ene-1,7-dioic acid hydratase in catechol pathway
MGHQRFIFTGVMDMTARDTQATVQALPLFQASDLEGRSQPVAVYLAGTVMVMNVCATVLSLMV